MRLRFVGMVKQPTTCMRVSDWAEYDSAARWCAKRGLGRFIETGPWPDSDRLPELLSQAVVDEIVEHREEFAERVRLFQYALAMGEGQS